MSDSTFNLEKALEGYEVVTRDGRPVYNIRVINPNAPKNAESVMYNTAEGKSENFSPGVRADIFIDSLNMDEFSFYHDGGAHLYGGENACDLKMVLDENGEYIMSSVTTFVQLVASSNITGISEVTFAKTNFTKGGQVFMNPRSFIQHKANQYKITPEKMADNYLAAMNPSNHEKVVGECEECHGFIIENKEHDCNENKNKPSVDAYPHISEHLEKIMCKG